jgi:hypothetical protein
MQTRARPEVYWIRMASKSGKAAWAACLFLLWGCDPFSTRPFEPRPGNLRPVSDTFADVPNRSFLWTEGVEGGQPDSAKVLRQFLLHVEDRGDTVAGRTLRQLVFSTADRSALPASAASALGFEVSRLYLDSVAIPDPGPDLPFPERPEIGWSVSRQIGALRFERTLSGVDTLSAGRGLVEAWVFAETARWDDQIVATARYWLGNRGLLRMRSEWPGGPENSGSGSDRLWREIEAR